MAQRVLGMVLDTSSITLVRLTGSARAYDIALTVQQFFPQDADKEADTDQNENAKQRKDCFSAVDSQQHSGNHRGQSK